MYNMEEYDNLVEEILLKGSVERNERTSTNCAVVIGKQLKFHMTDGAPVLTTRKLPVRNIIGELLGFFRGATSAMEFRVLGCNFWDANANDNKAWLANPNRVGEDDLGEIYGANWTNWTTIRHIPNHKPPEVVKFLRTKGWTIVGMAEGVHGYTAVAKSINQLEEVVRTILRDPTDRRILIYGGNPMAMDFQALPACHLTYKFIPITSDKTLHVVMDMRSSDVFLGLPANILSAALLLEVVSRLTGYKAGSVTLQLANAHIYSDHIPAAKELMTRRHLPPPSIHLSRNIKPIEHENEIYGCFARIAPTDISIVNYLYREPIKVAIAI